MCTHLSPSLLPAPGTGAAIFTSAPTDHIEREMYVCVYYIYIYICIYIYILIYDNILYVHVYISLSLSLSLYIYIYNTIWTYFGPTLCRDRNGHRTNCRLSLGARLPVGRGGRTYDICVDVYTHIAIHVYIYTYMGVHTLYVYIHIHPTQSSDSEQEVLQRRQRAGGQRCQEAESSLRCCATGLN